VCNEQQVLADLAEARMDEMEELKGLLQRLQLPKDKTPTEATPSVIQQEGNIHIENPEVLVSPLSTAPPESSGATSVAKVQKTTLNEEDDQVYEPSVASIRVFCEVVGCRLIVLSSVSPSYTKVDAPSILLTFAVRAAFFMGPAFGTILRDFSDEEYGVVTDAALKFWPNWILLGAFEPSKLGNTSQLQRQIAISDRRNKAVVTKDLKEGQNLFDVDFKEKRPPWRALKYFFFFFLFIVFSII
jgi:hypothetical protein